MFEYSFLSLIHILAVQMNGLIIFLNQLETWHLITATKTIQNYL